MHAPIKLYYHDGHINRKKPLSVLSNLIKYSTLHSPVYNIGDQISPVIVEALSARKVLHVQGFQKHKLISIGSILAAAREGDQIWGSGLKLKEHAQYLKKAKGFKIHAVRGPLTRKAVENVGISCPEVYGDPALLMPIIYPISKIQTNKIGIIPHISQVEELSELVVGTEYEVISPAMHWRLFLKKINSCRLILSSSLHGIILSDAYGVPAIPVKHQSWLSGSPFKFDDYYASTGRTPNFMDSKLLMDSSAINEYQASLKTPDIKLKPLVSSFPFDIPDKELLAKVTE